jgi:integrase
MRFPYGPPKLLRQATPINCERRGALVRYRWSVALYWLAAVWAVPKTALGPVSAPVPVSHQTAWAVSGRIHDERHLKGGAKGETRPVPCRPALTAILREHIRREGLKPGDQLFQGEYVGVLAGSVIRRAWAAARRSELTEVEHDSPLGRRVYDLRHTCLTTWLNHGIPPARVAEWAGDSVPVLLATCTRCLSGQLKDLQKRIEAAQDLTGLGGAPAGTGENSSRTSPRPPAKTRFRPATAGPGRPPGGPAPLPGDAPRRTR